MARKGGELIGTGECLKALANLKAATARAVGRRSLLPAANHLLGVAQANAPVLEGNLRASGRVDKRAQAKRRRVGAVDVTVIFDDVASAHVEFGTSDTAAQPYFRPAIESEQGRMFKLVGDDLQRETEAAAQRVAAKAAR